MAVTVIADSTIKKVENRGQYKEIFTGPKGFNRKTELEGTADQPKATVSSNIDKVVLEMLEDIC